MAAFTAFTSSSTITDRLHIVLRQPLAKEVSSGKASQIRLLLGGDPTTGTLGQLPAMAKKTKTASRVVKKTKRHRIKKPDDAYADLPTLGEAATLSEYLTVFYPYIDAESPKSYWFRGHGCLSHKLTPSAPRPDDVELRRRRLHRLDDFIRLAAIRIPNPPAPSERLNWMQIAQHYGLYTRLLDWSTSAAVGAYFACDEHEGRDGAVYMMEPEQLNSDWYGGDSRTLTLQADKTFLEQFERLSPSPDAKGPKDVAVELTLNNARVAAQRGAFTLHGNRYGHIEHGHNRTLVRVIIRGKAKREIRRQLAALGIDQLALFPEVDACAIT